MEEYQDEEENARAPFPQRLKSAVRKSIPEGLFFTFYFISTCFMTWPLVFKFNSVIYGFDGDNFGALWTWWWYRNAGLFTSNQSLCPLIGYPFGQKLNLFPYEFIYDGIARLLLVFFNELIVYNLIIFTSFFLSGITMYYLVRHVTKSKPTAFLGGFAYMVCTYHTFYSMSFANLAIIQFIPLAMLMLLRLIEKPNWKNTVILSLSLLLAAGTSIHYGLFALIFTISFPAGYFLYTALAARKAREVGIKTPEDNTAASPRKTLLFILAAVCATVVIIAPVFSLFMINENGNGDLSGMPTAGSLRITETIEAGAAKPLDYIIPNRENFTVGRITRALSINIDNYENALYLGWTMLIFAFITIYIYSKKRTKKTRETVDEGNGVISDADRDNSSTSLMHERAVLWGFFSGGLVAFILSMPPNIHIGDVSIPLPSFILQFAAPMLRWYQRFVVIVAACMIIIACIGISRLIKNKAALKQYAIAILLIIIVFCETAMVPPFKYIKTDTVPEIYLELEKLPSESSLVFYPAFEQALFAAQKYLFYQRSFKKPMLNGGFDGSGGEALRRTVYNPFNPAVPSILSRFGITHVVYLSKAFEEYEGTDPQEKEVTYLPPGLKPQSRHENESRYGDGYIFKVDAPKALLVPFYVGDISTPHMDEGRETVRLIAGRGTIRIENYADKTVEADIEIPVTNLSQPHHLVVTINEKTVWEGDVQNNQNIVLPNLKIPAEGINIELFPTGAELKIDPYEANFFGTSTALMKLGDVKIEPRNTP